MAIYNAYLEGAEREAAIFNMELDNQYDKLSLLYEISCMELEQAKKDIELKVFKENGTYDDLEYLISEAEAQAAQDQTNVVSEILRWLSGVVQKLVNTIKNIFTGSKNIPDNTPVDAPEDFVEPDKIDKAGKIIDMLSTFDENTNVNAFQENIGKILGVAGAVGTVFLINHGVKKLKKSTAGEVKQGVTLYEKLLNKFPAFAGRIQGVIDRLSKSNIPLLSSFCGNIKPQFDEYVRGITDWLTDKVNTGQSILDGIKNAGTTIANGVKDVAGAVTGNKDAAAGGSNQTNQAQSNTNTPDTVKGATLNQGKNGIVASVVDNGNTRKINLTGDGKVTNAVDTQPISPAIKQLIEGSSQVADAVKRYKKAQELLAKKNNKAAATPAQPQQTSNTSTAATQPAKESTLDDLSDDNYTVEMVNDELVVTINTVFECADDFMSTTQSIFGMIAEEEALEDPELVELQNLFNEL